MSKLLWISTLALFFISFTDYSEACDAVGCVDCYSWCETISVDYCETVPMLRKGCKKTCGACVSEHPDCLKLGCTHKCLFDTNNNAYCECEEGFKLNSDGSCSDIDECAIPNYCENTFGGSKKYCRNLFGTVSCQTCPADKDWFGYFQDPEEKCCKSDKEETCGKSVTNSGRIVGGNETNALYWPFMAHLTIGQYLCGGTLINKRWVLSAAHCFPQRKRHLGSVTVVLGVGDVNEGGEVNTQTFEAEDIIVHEDYTWPTHDIALIKLNKDVITSSFASPACLPSGEQPKTGQKCFAVGYGATSFGGAKAKNMMYVDLPAVDIDQCVEAYRGRREEVDRDNMLCAGYSPDDFQYKDACQGDSGGPILCQRCDNCNWYVAGITSFGKGCAEKGFYGVYTKVSTYESWIATQMSAGPVVNRGCKKQGWGEWTEWTSCTTTCGTGTEQRTRKCLSGEPGDPYCEGSHIQVLACTGLPPCSSGVITPTEIPTAAPTTTTKAPIAYWSDFQQVTDCSVTCGKGSQLWQRTCLTSGRSATCEGDAYEERPCEAVACAQWGEFGDWSECTAKCGGGIQVKLRACIGGEVGVAPECPAHEQSVTQECNAHRCPEYMDWVYEACSVSCGGGVQKGSRECETFGVAGALCVGPSTTTRTCKTQQCPRWGAYTSWSSCSVTCGGGKQTRTRNCLFGVAGQTGCHIGGVEDTKDCNTENCPKWSEWVANGGCSASCGNGVQSFTRKCIDGVVGQRGCLGSSTTSKSCNEGPCADWSPWTAWQSCSVTCGQGKKLRSRSCIGGAPGDGKCIGSSTSAQVCTKPACVVDQVDKCAALLDQVNLSTCVRYQSLDYCAIYSGWMSKYCAKTCCSKKCTIQPDTNSYCGYYFKRSEKYCDIDQFLRACNTSCGRCE